MVKRILLYALLVGLAATLVFAQKPAKKKAPAPGKKMAQNFQVRQKQLNLEEREMELNFKRQMRKLELDKKKFELEQKKKALRSKRYHRHGRHKRMAGFFFLCLVIHILLTVWVFKDMRQRNAGSGLWIVIVLLSGVCGALIYSLVRLGDLQSKKS